MTNKFKKILTDRGFSVAEMVIYVTVLTLILVIISNCVVSLIKSERMIRSIRNIDSSATLGFERINREIRQADNVDLALSVFDTNPGRLVLQGTDELGNARTVDFSLSAGELILTENGLNTGNLSQSGARVTNLVFRRFSSANSTGIKTEMTIESGTTTSYRAENFYSSALIR